MTTTQQGCVFLYFLLLLPRTKILTMIYSIEKQWEQFLKVKEAKEFNEDELANLKKMFYSGSAFILRLMINQIADMPEEQGVLTLDSLHNEANKELNL